MVSFRERCYSNWYDEVSDDDISKDNISNDDISGDDISDEISGFPNTTIFLTTKFPATKLPPSNFFISRLCLFTNLFSRWVFHLQRVRSDLCQGHHSPERRRCDASIQVLRQGQGRFHQSWRTQVSHHHTVTRFKNWLFLLGEQKIAFSKLFFVNLKIFQFLWQGFWTRLLVLGESKKRNAQKLRSSKFYL